MERIDSQSPMESYEPFSVEWFAQQGIVIKCFTPDNDPELTEDLYLATLGRHRISGDHSSQEEVLSYLRNNIIGVIVDCTIACVRDYAELREELNKMDDEQVQKEEQ